MSVLNPLSYLGSDRTSKRFRAVGFGVFLGLVAGGLGGFFVGRLYPSSQDQPPASSPAFPAPMERIPPAAAAPLPDGGTAPTPAATTTAIPPKDNVRRINLSISTSLYLTLASQLEQREADILNAQLGRILMWWLDLRREVLPGDRIQSLYEPVDGPGELRLLAVRYTSEKRNATHSAYFFHRPGARYGRYFDEQGQEVEQRLVDGPIQDYEQVTELMGSTGRRHRGIDFKTDVGTEVKLPFRAQVVRRNWHTRGNGNCLEVRYLKTGIAALLLHLDEVAAEARVGAILDAGTVVAHSGNTGHSTAPHLHYEIHAPDGRLLNPFRIHETGRSKLEGEDLKAFEERRSLLEQRLQGDGAKL